MEDLSIDELWITKQKGRIDNAPQLLAFVIADRFAEWVYGCKLLGYSKRIYKLEMRKILQMKNVFYESELVDQFWSDGGFERLYRGKMDSFKNEEIRKEMQRRFTIYNPDQLPIPEKELKTIAIKALSCFEAEKELVKRFKVI